MHRARSKVRAIGWSIGLLLALAAGPAFAHPHAWLDLKVEVLLDPAGRVTGLRQHWRFDDAYTLLILDLVGAGGRATLSQAGVERVVAENMRNLHGYDYFTTVWAGERRVAFGAIAEASGRMDDGRLLMSFTLPLAAPEPATGAGLTYRVADPTYFIEVLHAEAADAIRLVAAPASCRHTLIPPKPSAADVARAAALDRNQSGGAGLGALFAERVTIRCG